jgi:hypothetical protein
MEPSGGEKRGASLVGNVDAHATERGWFFGYFQKERLLQSELVEVAWQKGPGKTPSPEQAHFHRQTVEINVVLAGSIRLQLDGVEHHLRKGDFFVVWPECVVSDITTDADTEVLVVRAPSVPDDKVSARER